MPLITNNLIVGEIPISLPPTEEVPQLPPRFENIIENNVLAKTMAEIREEINHIAKTMVQIREEIQEQIEKEEHPIESHYVIKQDGVLERHFNTRSSYLTDMFSIDPESE